MSNRTKGQRSARLAGRTLARQRRNRRQRMLWTSILALLVVLASGLVGVVAWHAGQPNDVTAPRAVTADGLGLPTGTGPVTVDIYLDFLCPACKQFHDAANSILDGYLADGTVTVVYRPIAILDRLTTTEFSTRSASAAGCAADGGAIDEFVAEMMADQPPEGSAGLTDEQIVRIGADAGLAAPGFGECVRDGNYRNWVVRTTDAAADRGVSGTPTVLVDDQVLELSSVDDLVAAIEAARPYAGVEER